MRKNIGVAGLLVIAGVATTIVGGRLFPESVGEWFWWLSRGALYRYVRDNGFPQAADALAIMCLGMLGVCTALCGGVVIGITMGPKWRWYHSVAFAIGFEMSILGLAAPSWLQYSSAQACGLSVSAICDCAGAIAGGAAASWLRGRRKMFAAA